MSSPFSHFAKPGLVEIIAGSVLSLLAGVLLAALFLIFKPVASVESSAAKSGAKTNPLQRYIEVAGVRFVQDAKKKTMAKFLVINHSEADFSGLAGTVTIWGRTQKSEEDAQGTFSFTTTLGPFESKELSVPLNTKRKIYELGDWQNLTTDVQITAPAG